MKPRNYHPVLLRRSNLARIATKGQGFTLVELLVVAGIIVILVGLAVPQFLRTRSRAEANMKIQEAISLAKECALGQITGLKQTVTDSKGNIIECNGRNFAAIFTFSWDGKAGDLPCLDTTILDGETQGHITVEGGKIMCSPGLPPDLPIAAPPELPDAPVAAPEGPVAAPPGDEGDLP